jgi:hypothetical protein
MSGGILCSGGRSIRSWRNGNVSFRVMTGFGESCRFENLEASDGFKAL